MVLVELTIKYIRIQMFQTEFLVIEMLFIGELSLNYSIV